MRAKSGVSGDDFRSSFTMGMGSLLQGKVVAVLMGYARKSWLDRSPITTASLGIRAARSFTTVRWTCVPFVKSSSKACCQFDFKRVADKNDDEQRSYSVVRHEGRRGVNPVQKDKPMNSTRQTSPIPIAGSPRKYGAR